MVKEKKAGPPDSIKKFLRFIKPLKALGLITLGTILLTALFNIAQAHILKDIVNEAIARQVNGLRNYIIIIVCLMIFSNFLTFIRIYCHGLFSSKLLANVKLYTVQFVQRLPVSFYEQHRSGDIISRITNDLALLEQFVTWEFVPILSHFIMILGVSAYLLYMNWFLYLAVIIILPISLCIVHFLTRKLPAYAREAHTWLGQANALLKNAIEGERSLRVFNVKAALKETYNKRLGEELRCQLKILSVTKYLPVLYISMRFLPFVFCSILGCYFVYTGKLSVGLLIAFLNLIGQIVWPLSEIPRFLGSLRSVSGAVARLEEIWQHKTEDDLKTTTRLGGKGAGNKEVALEFASVSFKYPGTDTYVLKDLSFQVPRGGKVAIVGPSGSGKTTVLKLLCHFYEIDEGRIDLRGEDIKSLSLSEIRAALALLPQDTFIFPTDIRDNIRYGNLEASEEELERAARLANAHAFIIDKPGGYAAAVSEKGARLSAGEKLRLSLARTILRGAEICLLDEPGSSLDNFSLKIIGKTISEVLKDTTTIIVSHRLAAIRYVDEILVLDKGRLVERGRHDQLLEARGLYAELYEKQLAGGSPHGPEGAG